jgi:hypothetical protein
MYKSRTCGFVAVASAAVLVSIAGDAAGSIVYFNNSGGQFVWQESFYLAGFHHGTSLDITQPPSQSGEITPYSIHSFSESFLTSGETVTTSLRADASTVSVSQAPRILVNTPGPYARFVDPPVVYAVGELVSASTPNGDWDSYADVNWRSSQTDISLINGRAFVGVKLEMPDGPHYGWIDLIDNGYYASPSFVAAAWAWETTPNTPLPAGMVPGPGSLVCLMMAGMRVAQRRRP